MSRILFSLVFLACYIVWIAHRNNGWIPFLFFEALLVGIAVKSHYGFKRITKQSMIAHPDAFPNEAYWKVLSKFGVAIYTPLGAESLAVSFTFPSVPMIVRHFPPIV